MSDYYKDKECLRCERFFDCPGKPKEVDGRQKTLCIMFEERKKYGNKKNVHHEDM